MDERIAHSAADDLPESSVDSSPSVVRQSDSGLFSRMRDLLKNRIGQAMIATGIVGGMADQTISTVDAAENSASIRAELGGDKKGRATSVRIDGKTIGVDEDGELNDLQIQRGVPYYDENGELFYRKGETVSRIELNKQPRAYTPKPVLPSKKVAPVEEGQEQPDKPQAAPVQQEKIPTPRELLNRTLPKEDFINPHITGILKDRQGANLPKETRTWNMNPIALEPNGRGYRALSAVPPKEWKTVQHEVKFDVAFNDVRGKFDAVLILPFIHPYGDVAPLQTDVHVSETGLVNEEVSFVIITTEGKPQSSAFIRLRVAGLQPAANGKKYLPLEVTIKTTVAVPVPDASPATLQSIRSPSAVSMIGTRPGIEGAVTALTERGAVQSKGDALYQDSFFPYFIGNQPVSPKEENAVRWPFSGMPNTGVRTMKGAHNVSGQNGDGWGKVTHTVTDIDKPTEEIQALFKEFTAQRQTINGGGIVALGANNQAQD